MEQAARVFISYARQDAHTAEDIIARLKPLGIDAYLDQHDILPGEPWQERLSALILRSDAVVFLMTTASVASKMCDWEINEAERLSKRVIPIVADSIANDEVPPRLRRLNYIFYRSESEREKSIPAILTAVQVDITWVREHTRLSDLALAWENRGRRAELLLRGRALREAESWLLERPPQGVSPTEHQIQFIKAAQFAERRRSRASSAIFLAVAVAAILTGLYTWAQRNIAIAARQHTEAILERSRGIATSTTIDLLHKFRGTTGVSQDLMAEIMQGMLNLTRGLQQQDDRPGLAQARGMALAELSRILRATGEVQKARQRAAEAVSILKTVSDSDPLLPGIWSDLATAYDRLGDALLACGEPDKARVAFQDSLSLYQKQELEEKSERAERNIATAQEKIGRTYLALRAFKDADRWFEASLKRRESLRDDDSVLSRETAVVQEALGDSLLGQGQAERARAYYRTSAATAAKLSEKYPTSYIYKLDRAMRLSKLSETSDLRETAPLLDEASAILADLLESNPDLADLIEATLQLAAKKADLLANTSPADAASVILQADVSANEYAQRHPTNHEIIALRGINLIRAMTFFVSGSQQEQAMKAMETALPLLASSSADLSAGGKSDIAAAYDLAARFLHKNFPKSKAKAARAVAITRERITVLQSQSQDNDTLEHLARAYGDLAWYSLFALDFADAVEAARRAQKAYRDLALNVPRWISLNLVYSLFLVGRLSDAEAELTALRDGLAQDQQMIASDLAEFDAWEISTQELRGALLLPK